MGAGPFRIQQRTQTVDETVTWDTNLAAMYEKDNRWSRVVLAREKNKYALLNLLMTYLKGYDPKNNEYNPINQDRLQWFIQEQPNHLIQLLSTPSNNGANGQPFQVTCLSNLAREGHVVSWPSGVLARVQSDPMQATDGSGGWIYTMVLLKKNAVLSPTFDMVPGKYVSIYFSLYGEASKQGYSYNFLAQGWTQYMSMCRLSYGISDFADNHVTMLDYRDPDNPEKGYQKGLWFYKKQAEAISQFHHMVQMMLVEGQSTVDPNGESTHLYGIGNDEIKAGLGLLEYMNYGLNFNYYPGTTTFDWWAEKIFQLISVSAAEGNKEFIFVAGTEAYKEFNFAMQNYVFSNRISTNSEMLSKDKGKYKVAFEFDTIQNLFGCSLKVVPYWPWGAQYQYGHQLHPFTGKPLKAYDFVFIDATPLAGDDKNIEILSFGDKEKNMSNMSSFVQGMGDVRGMTGAAKSGPRANGGLVNEFHHLSRLALIFKYPYSSARGVAAV